MIPYYLITGKNYQGKRVNIDISLERGDVVKVKQRSIEHGCLWLIQKPSRTKELIYKIRNGDKYGR